ncbi:MAG: DUF1343 domain-containing protein [Turneriella sp.]|nr:DUF1343 domain-containing protein [Turneriella sp.]
MRTTNGLDIFLAEPQRYLQNRRFALLANQSSVAADGRYSFEALCAMGIFPERLFAPEHGLFGTEQDQVTVQDTTDGFTGLPVRSLYGQTLQELHPKPQDLDGIDVVIVDIQDIGCRYYTYAWTMAFVIAACARRDIAVIICDRPNPLGGEVVEGNLIKAGFTSFVGAYPVPVRHGLTLAEMALFLNATEKWQAKLEIIRMQNWQRGKLFPQTQGVWIPPSPNMPTFDTAVVYPGSCLFEATNISEGRGTTRPFEIVGAPFIDPKRYAAALNALQLPGVYFRPLYFRPTFHKYQDQVCGGVFIHVTDVSQFAAYYTGLWMVKIARELYPDQFAWRTESYEYVTDILAVDLLTGSAEFRNVVEKGDDLATLYANWQKEADEFRIKRADFLLY